MNPNPQRPAVSNKKRWGPQKVRKHNIETMKHQCKLMWFFWGDDEKLGGGFKDSLFSPLLGEMIHFH